MPCRSIHCWTLSSLVGSYIDLAVAYLLLIGSTIVFFASKFLSLFGLALPCPCDGLFGHPRCIQTLLVDSPTSRIAAVHSAVRNRFPFDAIFGDDQGSVDRGLSLGGPGGLELVGPPEGEGKGKGKGKGVVVGRARRRRGSSSGRGSSVPASNLKSLSWNWGREGVSDNFDVGGREQESGFEDCSVGVSSGVSYRFLEGCDVLVDEVTSSTKFYSAEKDIASGVRDASLCNRDESIIRELEEAHAAHAAVYLELEKERSAAATAADEAMAMILRLQNEKAAVQMEARQYQRMIEEKSAYDEEEMEILKEIIVRREREKHVLEKEVEAFRQMMLSGEMSGEKLNSSLDSYEDPMLMLKTIYKSIGTKEMVKVKKKWVDDGIGKRHLEFTNCGDESNQEFQEKGMLTAEVYPSSEQVQSSRSGEPSVEHAFDNSQTLVFHKATSATTGEADCEAESNIEMGVCFDDLGEGDGHNADQGGSDEAESNVLDVHVVDDKYNPSDQGVGEEHDVNQIGCVLGISGKGDVTNESSGTAFVDISAKKPVRSSAGLELDDHKSYLDMTMRSQSMDGLGQDTLHFESRRSSMSAVDSERFKLETEIELFRKRLKAIQKGRERLSFPVEYREKEAFQLQLLEDITRQLQEIRKISEPGKSVRQVSLPPQSSKVDTILGVNNIAQSCHESFEVKDLRRAMQRICRITDNVIESHHLVRMPDASFDLPSSSSSSKHHTDGSLLLDDAPDDSPPSFRGPSSSPLPPREPTPREPSSREPSLREPSKPGILRIFQRRRKHINPSDASTSAGSSHRSSSRRR